MKKAFQTDQRTDEETLVYGCQDASDKKTARLIAEQKDIVYLWMKRRGKNQEQDQPLFLEKIFDTL